MNGRFRPAPWGCGGRARARLRVLGTAAVATAIAARGAGAQLHVGLQSGATASTLAGTFAEQAAPVLGGTIAIDLEYWLGDRWVVDVDLGLVQRGAGDLLVDGDTVDYRINYLEVPIALGRAFTPFGERWMVAPYLGAAIGRVSACGVRFEGQWGYMDCDEQTPGGAAQRWDVSFPIGVALRHRYPGGARLSFDLRYSRSLSSALAPGDRVARSHLLQALVAFVVPLRRVPP